MYPDYDHASTAYLSADREYTGPHELKMQAVTANESSGPKPLHVVFVSGVVALQPGGTVLPWVNARLHVL